MKSIDLAGRPWTPPSSTSNLQDGRRLGAVSSLSSPPSPPPLLLGPDFFLLSFQFPFDVPVISAFHLMKISPGGWLCMQGLFRESLHTRSCLLSSEAAQGCAWSGSVGGLGAGDSPLGSEQPHTWSPAPGSAPSLLSLLPSSISIPPSPSLLCLPPSSISLPPPSPPETL